jgi:cytochrome c-type biogenesis protein
MTLDLASLIFVSTAGVFTLLSPCSYPLLPGYILYHIGAELSTKKALMGGVLCVLGLISVFAVVGLAAWIVRSVLLFILPVFELAAAVLIIFMGICLLKGESFLAFRFQIVSPKQKGLAGLFVFGVAYGMAAAGCSAPIFFSMLLYAVLTGGFLNVATTFLVYALAMGVPLIGISLLTVKARDIAIKKIVWITPWLQKLSGVFLLIIGFYLIYLYYTVYYVK